MKLRRKEEVIRTSKGFKVTKEEKLDIPPVFWVCLTSLVLAFGGHDMIAFLTALASLSSSFFR